MYVLYYNIKYLLTELYVAAEGCLLLTTVVRTFFIGFSIILPYRLATLVTEIGETDRCSSHGYCSSSHY